MKSVAGAVEFEALSWDFPMPGCPATRTPAGQGGAAPRHGTREHDQDFRRPGMGLGVNRLWNPRPGPEAGEEPRSCARAYTRPRGSSPARNRVRSAVFIGSPRSSEERSRNRRSNSDERRAQALLRAGWLFARPRTRGCSEQIAPCDVRHVGVAALSGMTLGCWLAEDCARFTTGACRRPGPKLFAIMHTRSDLDGPGTSRTMACTRSARTSTKNHPGSRTITIAPRDQRAANQSARATSVLTIAA